MEMLYVSIHFSYSYSFVAHRFIFETTKTQKHQDKKIGLAIKMKEFNKRMRHICHVSFWYGIAMFLHVQWIYRPSLLQCRMPYILSDHVNKMTPICIRLPGIQESTAHEKYIYICICVLLLLLNQTNYSGLSIEQNE